MHDPSSRHCLYCCGRVEDNYVREAYTHEKQSDNTNRGHGATSFQTWWEMSETRGKKGIVVAFEMEKYSLSHFRIPTLWTIVPSHFRSSLLSSLPLSNLRKKCNLKNIDCTWALEGYHIVTDFCYYDENGSAEELSVYYLSNGECFHQCGDVCWFSLFVCSLQSPIFDWSCCIFFFFFFRKLLKERKQTFVHLVLTTLC